MSQYDNAKLTAGVTPLAAGAVYVDVQETDLAHADFIDAAVASGDLIQVGVVPANCVLVPHLSKVVFPTLDASATVALGTKTDSDALLAAAAITAATTKFGHELTQAVIGDDYNDTPIYAAVGGTVAGFATTGTIELQLALRAWRHDVDA